MPDADFRADPATLDGHPFVVELPAATKAAAHHTHVAHVLALGPVAGVIDEIGVEFLVFYRVFQRAVLLALYGSKPQHVGLAEQDVNLHRLGHVRRFAIGVGQCLGRLAKRSNG